MGKHIVVIGGGIGGIAVSYYLRKLNRNIKITIISDRSYFGFTPSYPHLAMGWRKFEDITVPLAPLLPRFGIGFINEAVEKIEPEKEEVKTISGRSIGYDYLVVATGPKLVFSAEGQEENASSICTAEHAIETRRRLEVFFEDPGPAVVGAIPGVSCFGPAYEFVLMLHYELVKRGLRTKVPLTYITSEPYEGHMGLGGIGPSRRLMEDLFAEKDIKCITNVRIKAVEKDKVIYEDLEGNEKEVPTHFTMLMPRFEGPEAIAFAGDKLAHSKNKMLIVNKCFQNPTYGNIYGVGVVTFLPPVELTPVPTGTPKTGQMIEGMAMAVALNIINDINNSPDRYTPTLAAICIADTGDEAVGFLANPVLPPRMWVKTKKGKWLHYLKTAFEKYFIWKVKSGNIAPWFEEKVFEFLFKSKLVKLCSSCENFS